VGCAGQHASLRGHERFDPLGGAVEAARQRGHLVVALHRHAGRQVSAAQRVDAHPQPFQAAGEASDQRVGADRHGHDQQRQGEQEARQVGPAWLAVQRRDPTAVRQAQRQRQAAPRVEPVAVLAAGLRLRKPGPRRRQRRVIGREGRQVDGQAARGLLQRPLQVVQRAVRAGQHVGHDPAQAVGEAQWRGVGRAAQASHTSRPKSSRMPTSVRWI